MYDTLTIWQSSERLLDRGYLKTIPLLLTNTRYSQKENGSTFISGSLENLLVNVNDFGISIKGSINKYCHGDNFCKLTRQDMQIGVEKLQDALQTSLLDAQLRRIDLAHNFIVKEDVKQYYNLLGDSQYYTRLSQPNSIYYNNGLKTKLFYDKIKEGKYRGLQIPPIWNNKNVLRYELRFMKNIANQFKQEKVLLSDLYDEVFYMRIINSWSDEYFKIKKNKLLTPKISNMTNKEAQERLLSSLITMFGQNEVNNIVDSWKSHFSTSKEAQRFKKSLINLKDLTEESPLIKELDEKINSIQEYYR